MDKRKRAALDRLRSLSKEERQRIIDNQNLLCLDTYNYDERAHTYCPLALAMNLHNSIGYPTDGKISNAIAERFYPVNILKGVAGEFYTTNRLADLLNLIAQCP